MATKEIRKLLIDVPEPSEPGGREIREVHVSVIFSDGSWSNVKTHTSMNPWDSGDLLNTVKGFVRALEGE
jgi:hypothetical protein